MRYFFLFTLAKRGEGYVWTFIQFHCVSWFWYKNIIFLQRIFFSTFEVSLLIPSCYLHVLELIDPSLGVAFPDLPQGLVLVSSLPDVLLVDAVHRRLASLVPCVSQVLLQRLQLIVKTFVTLSKGQAIVDRVLDVILWGQFNKQFLTWVKMKKVKQ